MELGREEPLKGLREENKNMGKGEGMCRKIPAVPAIINMDFEDCNSKLNPFFQSSLCCKVANPCGIKAGWIFLTIY